MLIRETSYSDKYHLRTNSQLTADIDYIRYLKHSCGVIHRQKVDTSPMTVQ